MHPFALIEQWWWAGLPAAIAVGIVLGASPLAWPILATAVGVRAGGTDADAAGGAGRAADPGARGRGGLPVLALGAGITVVYATLGLATGQLERLVREVMGAWSGVGYVALAVAAGLGGLLLLARPAPTCRVLSRPPSGAPAAFLVGIPLGIVNCPACAGIITGVAVSAAALGSTAYSVAVMAALGLGHTLTLLAISRLSLNALGAFTRTGAALQRLGGVLLVLAAAFFAFQATAMGTGLDATLP